MMTMRLVAGLLMMFSFAAMPVSAKPLQVMSFNVRVPVDTDTNAWARRRDLLVQTIRQAAPDIIGTQELRWEQGDYIVTKLPAYRWFGIDRHGGHDDEHMGLFFRADRVTLESFGNFWLSDTPATPGSICWGHPYPRMVTWGIFTSRSSGRRFAVANTHFPYRAEDEPARVKAAQAVISWAKGLPDDMPVIIMGDFNTTPESAAYARLTSDFTDMWVTAPRRVGPEGTFHGFSGKPDRRIDWILSRGFTSLRAETIETHKGAAYPSDHFPVLVELAE